MNRMEVGLRLPIIPDVELIAAKAVEVVSRGFGMSDTQIESVTVATVEACLNAVEHGNRNGFEVRLGQASDEDGSWLVIEVEDHGEGFDPEAVPRSNPARVQGCTSKRGWGLTLIRELMDGVEVRSRPGLTIVRMRKRIGGEP